MTGGTTHYMKREKPLRGNSFYRDRSERKFPGLFCGAELPRFESDSPLFSFVPWNHKNEAWTNAAGVEFLPCPACVAKRNDYKSWWDTKGPGARRRAKRMAQR
jgi:hypothetical protein